MSPFSYAHPLNFVIPCPEIVSTSLLPTWENAVPESDVQNPPLSGPVCLSIPPSCCPAVFGCQAMWSAHLHLTAHMPLPSHLRVICRNILSSCVTFPVPPTPPHPTDCPTPSSSLLCVFLTLPPSSLSYIHIALHYTYVHRHTSPSFIPKYMSWNVYISCSKHVCWMNKSDRRRQATTEF